MTAPERHSSLLRLFSEWVVKVSLCAVPFVAIGVVNFAFGDFS